MSDSPDPAGPVSAATRSSGRSRVVLCPYCGNTQHRDDRCESCGGLFEPLSRMATQIAMGPWYIRDKAHPFRPGFSYQTLKKMIDNGRISPTTIIRGPSTHQFWSVARNTPAVAHLVGFCHSCGHHVSPTDSRCEQCGASFERSFARDHLGLQYPDEKSAVAAQRKLEAMLDPAREQDHADENRTGALHTSSQADDGGDLLQKTLGLGGDVTITQGGADQSQMLKSQTDSTQAQPDETASATAHNPQKDTANFPGALSGYRDTQNEPAIATSATPPASSDEQPATAGSGGVSPWVWVLLLLNIFAALAVVILFLVTRG